MRFKIYTLLALLTVFAISGCETTTEKDLVCADQARQVRLLNSYNRMKVGMSQAQVKKIAGKPDTIQIHNNVRLKKKEELWHYNVNYIDEKGINYPYSALKLTFPITESGKESKLVKKWYSKLKGTEYNKKDYSYYKLDKHGKPLK